MTNGALEAADETKKQEKIEAAKAKKAADSTVDKGKGKKRRRILFGR